MLRWAKETKGADGSRVIEREWVQQTLGRVHAVSEAIKLANWRVAATLGEGALDPSHASAMKVLGTEQQVTCLRLLMDVVGAESLVADGSPGAVLRGQLEQAYRQAPVGTFGGGVNEVQREIIGMVGLGMPRAAPLGTRSARRRRVREHLAERRVSVGADRPASVVREVQAPTRAARRP